MMRLIEQTAGALLSLLVYNPAIGIIVIVIISLFLYNRVKAGGSIGIPGVMLGLSVFLVLWNLGLKGPISWLLKLVFTILFMAGIIIVLAIVVGYVLEGNNLVRKGKTNEVLRGFLGKTKHSSSVSTSGDKSADVNRGPSGTERARTE